MASAAVDNAKVFAEEQLATLRVKLNQIPALQQVEVSERESLGLSISSDSIISGSRDNTSQSNISCRRYMISIVENGERCAIYQCLVCD